MLLPTVEPVEGEFGRYWVQSASRPNLRHLVDMKANGGNGWCGCEDFAKRFQPHLDRGAKPSRLLACRHVRVAREFSAVELWVTLVKAEERQNEETKRRMRHGNQAKERTEEEGALDDAPERKVYVVRPTR